MRYVAFASHFGALAEGSKPTERLKLVVGGLVRGVRVRLSGIEISGYDDGGNDAAAAARDGCGEGEVVMETFRLCLRMEIVVVSW